MAPVTITARRALQRLGVLHDTAPPTAVEKPSAARRRLLLAWLTLRTWLARCRRQQELSNLSDHLLRDLNLSPSEAGREYTRSFWPPVH